MEPKKNEKLSIFYLNYLSVKKLNKLLENKEA